MNNQTEESIHYLIVCDHCNTIFACTTTIKSRETDKPRFCVDCKQKRIKCRYCFAKYLEIESRKYLTARCPRCFGRREEV